jgi:hypothetical protein
MFVRENEEPLWIILRTAYREQQAQAVSLFITDMLALSSVRRARPRVKTSQQDGENAG